MQYAKIIYILALILVCTANSILWSLILIVIISGIYLWAYVDYCTDKILKIKNERKYQYLYFAKKNTAIKAEKGLKNNYNTRKENVNVKH